MLLYPFAATAVAINLYLGGLIATFAGWGVLSPIASLIASVPLGIPAAWASGLWVRGLLDRAEA